MALAKVFKKENIIETAMICNCIDDGRVNKRLLIANIARRKFLISVVLQSKTGKVLAY
jgi:hypothetical protein